MRIHFVALIVAGYLACATLAKADAIYTLHDMTFGYSWSFEVPAIINTSTTTTIASFLNTQTVPGGYVASNCPTLVEVTLGPNGGFSDFTNVSSDFVGGPLGMSFSVVTVFPGHLDSFGTFKQAGQGNRTTLDIEPAPAVSEPSTLLLLGAGLICALGMARRKFRSCSSSLFVLLGR